MNGLRRNQISKVWLWKIHRCKDSWWMIILLHPSWLGETVICFHEPPKPLTPSVLASGHHLQRSGWKIICPSQYPTKPRCFGCGKCKTLSHWIATLQRKLPDKYHFSGTWKWTSSFLWRWTKPESASSVFFSSMLCNSRNMRRIYKNS